LKKEAEVATPRPDAPGGHACTTRGFTLRVPSSNGCGNHQGYGSPIDLVLSRLTHPKKTPQGWTARCPAHSDQHPSLDIALGSDGKVLLTCRSHHCTVESICTALSISVADLFPMNDTNHSSRGAPRMVAQYTYEDESGAFKYQACRWEPGFEGQDKSFTLRRRDGRDGWINNLDGVARILYRLPEVVNAPEDALIWIAEGEKCVEALRGLGFIATTSPCGANAKWLPSYNGPLRGRPVIILPDNDEPGQQYAQKVASALQGVAASVKRLDLPGLPEAGDVVDWLEAGGTAEQLKAMALEAPAFAGDGQAGAGESASAEAGEEWDEPIELDERPAVPDFPTNLLPKWLADWVSGISLSTQTPPDLAGMLSLAEVGAGIARNYRVVIRAGWSEPTNIYTVAALPSGERKSTVVSEAMSPVQEFEKQRIEDEGPGIAEKASAHRVLEGQLRSVEGKAAKATDAGKKAALKQEARSLARDLDADVVPALPQCYCDDATPEALTKLLDEQNGRMFQVGAEGTVFDIVKGRYSDMPNFDVYLKAHAGDTMRTNRVGRSKEFIDDPALSCAIATQPDVIHGLAEQAVMRLRGFLARWLYSLPKSRVGSRDVAPPAMNEKVAADFSRYMKLVWGLKGTMGQDGKPAPYYLKFSQEADLAMQEFEKWLEPQLAEGEELSLMAGWANKLAGAIARIAGILHIAEATEDLEKKSLDPISKDIVERAIKIGRDYLLPHAKAAFALMGTDPKMAAAKHVLEWIAKTCECSEYSESAPLKISRRAIHQGNRRRFTTVDDVDPVIELLVRLGWLRPIGEGRKGRGGNPSPEYLVHPSITTRKPK
jgi:hypothetical protein